MKFSTLQTEYDNEVQRKELEENAKRNVAAENAETVTLMKSQHDQAMREMNKRFSTLQTEYDNEVQRKELEEHAKRNVAAENVKAIALMKSQHDKEMREMNERFSTLELEYNNAVQRIKSLQSEVQSAHQSHTPVTQVFSEVTAVLNLVTLAHLESKGVDVHKLLKNYEKKNDVKLTKGQNSEWNISGTLKQITELEQIMMAESNTDIHVLATGLDDEVQDFLQKLFLQRRKRQEHKAVENVKYKLSPFCAMWVKNWDRLKPFLDHVEVYLKKFTLDDDNDITIKYSSDDQTNISEFKKIIKRLYDENLKIVREELQDPGSDQYLKGLLRTIHEKFKPLFAMILENQHLFVELLHFDTEHTAFKKLIAQSENEKQQNSVENGKKGKNHMNTDVLDINKTEWTNITSDDEDSNGRVGAGAIATFQRQISEDPIQTEIEVDPDTMEYIRLFCQEDLHGIAEEYGVVLDDTDAGAGRIKLMSFQGQPVPAIAMQKVRQYIQDTYYDLLNTRINIASVSDILQDKWKEIIQCGIEYKAWIVPPDLKQGDSDIFIMANKDVIDIVVDAVKQIIGIAPKMKKRDKLLGKISQSNVFPVSKNDAKNHESMQTEYSKSYTDKFSDMDINVGTKQPQRERPRERVMVPDSSSSNFSASETEMEVDVKPNCGGLSIATPMKYKHKRSAVIVEALVGDITKLNVGGVVNAANEDLKHYGGVAMAISKAGGYIIDDESKRYIRTHGKLAIAATCVTSAGKMPAIKVIHTVGPQWSHHRPEKCLKQLNDTFTNVLQAANKEKLKSVAIPAISAGIYGVPPTIVADTAITSITEYLSNNTTKSSLLRIVLVDIDDEMVLLFQEELDKKVDGGVYSVESGGKGAAGYTPTASKAVGGKGARPKTPSGTSSGTSVRRMNAADMKSGSGTITKHNTSSIIADKDSKSQQTPATSTQVEEEEDNCCICMCPPTNPKTLKCKHTFCTECIDRGFKIKPACPVCGTIYGEITGDQPRNGKMDVKKERGIRLPGCTGSGAIVIEYYFPDGTQSAEHPNPGKPYSGTHRTAYLPDNTEGNKVLKLLRKAFNARLVFTVGSSRTTGKSGTVTWNDIHHKTNQNGGPQRFGYPDDTYLSRVQEELAAKGIK